MAAGGPLGGAELLRLKDLLGLSLEELKELVERGPSQTLKRA
jgi:hypothetical protein